MAYKYFKRAKVCILKKIEAELGPVSIAKYCRWKSLKSSKFVFICFRFCFKSSFLKMTEKRQANYLKDFDG